MKKSMIKKSTIGKQLISIPLLCIILLTACGAQRTGYEQKDMVKYYDIQSDTEILFTKEEERDFLEFLGIQFYQGEPVMLKAVRKSEGDVVDIYMYREDGGRELTLQDVLYRSGDWFLDQEGSAYCIQNKMEQGVVKSKITKLDSSGEVIYTKTHENVQDICQLADERIFLLNRKSVDRNGYSTFEYGLAELDPATGNVQEIKGLRLQNVKGIGSGEQDLIYLDENGFWTVDPEQPSTSPAFVFTSTSYFDREDELGTLQAFQMTEDGDMELMRAEQMGSEAVLETLRMVEVDRIPLVIRGMQLNLNDDWLREQVVLFNQTNETYHVVLEERGQGTDREDFARLTSVQIATGGGPDILVGDVVEDYVYGMIKNGALVDLSPYMEKSGIREEDYYPVAFSAYRQGDGIFGVNIGMGYGFEGYQIREEVLGTRQEPDVETLVDALLAYEGSGFFRSVSSSREFMEYFLAGSENLWGMVDWDNGTCDFGGELFAKILETAKRYGGNDGNSTSIVADWRYCSDIVMFSSSADQEAEGWMTCGYLFDDGCHPLTNIRAETMAINANSSHVEGAWEFLAYLLGEEAQSAFPYYTLLPVKRSEVKAKIDLMLANRDAGKYESSAGFFYIDGEWVRVKKTTETLTDEEVEEFYQCLEGVRSYPLRPAPILDIIYEEAEDYFNGIKGVEQVVNIIENRVNLYLSENSI